jgi:coproporphyrinogen III oxidase-like Fe-S oxidoreductase
MAALRREPVAQAMPAVARLVDDGLLASDGKTIRLTVQGRLLSNDVFQQFLGLD